MAFNKAKAMQDAEKLISQGKVPQAISMYQWILERDPSDLTLLNTIGDLYYRERKVSEALASYHQLADAYCQEGFIVKAIAIYKKIIKIEQKTAGPLLKLAELYMLQGLTREARDHLAQAVEFFRRKNQPDKALEVYRKIVSLDPENANYRAKFVEFCEQIGKKAEAAEACIKVAEISLRRGEVTGAENALRKASQLDPTSLHVQLLRARVALAKRDLAQVEKIIEGTPALRNFPEASQLLLEAYLAAQKLEKAAELVAQVWRAHPENFAPVASYAALATEQEEFDAAFLVLNTAADTLLQRRETAELSERLKRIWAKAPNHIPTLELLYRVSEAAADVSTLADVLEALGHAYVQAGRLEDAEVAYERLLAREPVNEHYKRLLRQVQERMGKEPTLTGAAQTLYEVELAPLVEAEPVEAPEIGEEEAAAVRDALENSDLYSRYGLVEKAVAELEKTLVAYPDQVEIHKRILEICHRSLPERARQAAEQLADIYSRRGDAAAAARYESLGGKLGGEAGLEEFAPPASTIRPAQEPATSPLEEIDLGMQSPSLVEGVGERAPAFGPPPEMPVPGLSEPVSPQGPPSHAAEEIDFSSDFEAFTGGSSAGAPAPRKDTFNYEESRVEIDFYLEQGLLEEARAAIEILEQRFPGHPKVAELRELFDAHAALVGEDGGPIVAPVESEPASAAQPGSEAEWDLPGSFASTPDAGEAAGVSETEGFEAPQSAREPASVSETEGPGLLGSLVSDLAGSLEGIEVPEAPSKTREPVAAGVSSAGGEGLFSDLLEELGGGSGAEAEPEDAETHYNLGVAFREMGLLDEAIGEFQKVVKGAREGSHPPNFLQACTLLAACFMEKDLPAIAAKWYARALEAPDLNEDSVLALQYDLGVAYEKAGDLRTALAKFSEVYAHNIDFRDVAEKIRQLQKGG